jgi:hypothetical protein
MALVIDDDYSSWILMAGLGDVDDGPRTGQDDGSQ